MTLTGRAVVLALLGVVPVLLRPEPLTATLWLVLVVVVAGVDALLAVSPRRLSITRDRVGTIRAETTTTTRLQVHNASRRTARGVLRDAWQPSAGTSGERHRIAVAPGASVEVETALTPVRRGDRHTDLVTVRTLGPLGIAGRQASVDVPGTVRVLPPFHSRRHLPSRLARLRQIDGRSAVRVRGQGTEFDSLREYVEGDDVRSIDWRASARRSELVVRTWRPERDRRITLVFDTSRLSAGRVDDTTRLDAAIEASLLLTALAAHAGDHVDLVAGDRVVRAQLAGVARTDLLAAVSDALATVQPAIVEADWQSLASAVARQARRPSLLVLLTPLEPAAVAESLLPVLPLLTRRQRVCIASCADPDLDRMASARRTAEEAYGAAAAERTRTQRTQTADALAGLGVTVVDAPPQDLAPALADHYLMLKSRGLL